MQEIDRELNKMRLPEYYETPRFHTSLCWSTSTSLSTATTPPASPLAAAPPSEEPVGAPPNSTPDHDQPTGNTSALPFDDATLLDLEARLGRGLREEESYVAQVCVKIGKEVKRFPLAN